MSNQFGKNFFAKEKRVPAPRLKGKAIPRPDKTFTWDLDIFIGEDYVASICHPPDAPGFLTHLGAVEDMKKHAMDAAKLICKEAYGEEPDKYFDFTTNEFVTQL